MNRPPHRAPNIFIMTLAFEGGLAVIAVGIAWWIRYDLLASCARDFASRGILSNLGMAGVAATIPLLFGAWIVNRISWRSIRSMNRMVSRFVRKLFGSFSVTQLALVSMFAGVGEEWLFRGVLIEGPCLLAVHDWTPYISLILSSLLFGLAHAFTRTYFVLASLAGFYFGGLYLISQSLLPSTIAHGLYDFVILLIILRSRGFHAKAQEKVH